MGPMWIHWGEHFLILNFTVYSTETGFLGIRGTLFYRQVYFQSLGFPWSFLQSLQVSHPDCYWSVLHRAKNFLSGSNWEKLLPLPFPTPLHLVQKVYSVQEHTERHDASATGERCYLLPDAVIFGLCCTVWQFQTSCNAYQKSLGKKKKKGRKGGCAESQTKVEFMGK